MGDISGKTDKFKRDLGGKSAEGELQGAGNKEESTRMQPKW